MKLLKPGENAPSFSLYDQNGVLINFSSFLGQKILIYFYPKSMTPGCTKQACDLRDNIDIFKKFTIKIIGISTDIPEKLLKFSEKEMLNFTLLSDQNHQISEKYGVWGKKEFMGRIYLGIHRISFIINQKGIIEKVFKNFTPNTHITTILNYINH